MVQFPCPYLETEVEVTEERRRHIVERHPDLLLAGWEHIATTLADPDQVRHSMRIVNARMFYRWYDGLNKHVVVVVISEPGGRNWIVTAYLARKLATGEMEWKRS